MCFFDFFIRIFSGRFATSGSLVAVLVSEIWAGTLSVTEKKEKEKALAWSILCSSWILSAGAYTVVNEKLHILQLKRFSACA